MNGMDNLRNRLQFRGGSLQQDRMIKDKRETLDRVVYHSYQGANVSAIGENSVYKALINPNKLKQDYDDKVISIGYESNFKPGTVFDWNNTGTRWLIYLQDLTELAYFRGDIRRCCYTISWKDENGKVRSIDAAVRGPVETKINFIQKAGISVDEPNHSLDILMPKNEHTLKYFLRYSKFYLKGLDNGDEQICWRVEARDSISMPGILELVAVEYYSNEMRDDIEAGVADGLVVTPIEPPLNEIHGQGFIKPKISYEYTYVGSDEGEWQFDKKLPLTYVTNGRTITLKWEKSYTGQFVLKYGDVEKTIVVESMF